MNGRFSWLKDGNNIHHFHPHFIGHISVSARIQSGWEINVPSKTKKNVHTVSIDSAFLICNSDHYISILSGFPLRRQVPPRPCIKLNVWMWKLVTQSSLSLCDPMDCSPPGSSVLGLLQARVLEWVAISFSRGSSWPRDWTQVFAGRFFILWVAREVQSVSVCGSWSSYSIKEIKNLLC